MDSYDFYHLHNHSEHSLLDGMSKVEEYILKANELGQKALALTEHGNFRSIYQLQVKSNKKFAYKGIEYDLPPIKPIFGIEFYMVAYDLRIKGTPAEIKLKLESQFNGKQLQEKIKESNKKFRQRYHLLAFAKNNVGLKNLFILHYYSWKDGFYYRPRINFKLLQQYHEGLIITSACIGGYIPTLIIKQDWKRIERAIKYLKRMFKDDFYIELQPHDIDDQRIVNKYLIYLADEYKIKTIATNDCHYTEKNDWEAHEVMLAIQSDKTMRDPDRWRFDSTEFYMKSKQEMFDSFKKYHPDISENEINKALLNTGEIIDKCNASLEVNWKKGLLPKINVPKEFDSENKYLVSIIKDGWKWRDITDRSKKYAEEHGITQRMAIKIYKDRLKMELNRIFKLRFSKYFLLIWDLINWARKNDIMVGPGRGSAAASLVAFLMGITSIDPVHYDLLFDRFLSENRIDYPDVDMDFQDDRRKEIFEYLIEKYGKEYVCQIGTIGKMKGKSCLLNVGRVFGVSPQETWIVNKHIIERSSGDARSSQTVQDSFNEFEVCKEYNKRHPEILKYVIKLEGRATQLGIHAAGVQISPVPMHELVPIEYRKSDNKPLKVSSLDWMENQALGLVKLDVLGLSTLTIIKNALKAIRQRYNVEIDIENVDLKDSSVLDNFTNTNFVGIFQFDSIGMTNTCKDGNFVFESFGDVIILNAVYRPGTLRSGQASHFINRKTGKEKIKKLHPIYDKITEKTQGILIYQEQLIKCFIQMANYDPGTADELRKKIAKSHGVEVLTKEKDAFVKGSVKNGMDRGVALNLFENIAFAGSYAFNQCIDGDMRLKRYVGDANFYPTISEMYKIKNDYSYAKKIGKTSLHSKYKYSGYGTAFSLNENNRLVNNKIKNIHYQGKQKVYKFYFNDGKNYFSVTLNHKIPKKFNYEILAENLHVGDKIITCVGYIQDNKPYTFSKDFIGGADNYPVKGQMGFQTKDTAYTKLNEYRKYHKKDYCEICGLENTRLEIHHIDGNHLNSDYDNFITLCPGCHKKEHYKMGRVKQGQKGLYTEYTKITKIEYIGTKDVYDVGMEHPYHTITLDSGAVISNSHATAYSMISFWTMYLKTHYPTEFYWSLMSNEKDQIKLTKFIDDARKNGIKILMSDINKSSIGFIIEDNRLIRIGLIDIKTVGIKAATDISEKQPYFSMHDFCNKVNRRIVHKGVINALIRSNAFRSLYSDIGALLFEVGDKFVWQKMLDMDEKSGNELYDLYVGDNIYNEEKLVFSMAKFCPVQSDKHFISYYHVIDKYLDKNFKLYDIDDIDETFANYSSRIRLKGIQLDIKYNNIGDFHKEEPSEKIKKRIGWGNRYANINVEDESGMKRMLIDYDVFSTFRPVIDMGDKTPVLISGRSYNGKTLNIDVIVEIESMKLILEDKTLTLKDKYLKMNKFQRYFIHHPIKNYKKIGRFTPLNKLRVGNNRICVLIMRVKKHWTKKEKLMYFISLEDDTGGIEGIVWPEKVIKYADKLKTGNIIIAILHHSKDGNFINVVLSMEKKYFNFAN